MCASKYYNRAAAVGRFLLEISWELQSKKSSIITLENY